jgi:hypothetical protein
MVSFCGLLSGVFPTSCSYKPLYRCHFIVLYSIPYSGNFVRCLFKNVPHSTAAVNILSACCGGLVTDLSWCQWYVTFTQDTLRPHTPGRRWLWAAGHSKVNWHEQTSCRLRSIHSLVINMVTAQSGTRTSYPFSYQLNSETDWATRGQETNDWNDGWMDEAGACVVVLNNSVQLDAQTMMHLSVQLVDSNCDTSSVTASWQLTQIEHIWRGVRVNEKQDWGGVMCMVLSSDWTPCHSKYFTPLYPAIYPFSAFMCGVCVRALAYACVCACVCVTVRARCFLQAEYVYLLYFFF